jgi:antagonist of KipI
VAGAMDSRAHRVANALVGNERHAATLEITLIGPEVEFEAESAAAVSGGECPVVLNGAPVPSNTAFVAAPGSRLRIGRCTRGARVYLAVAGGIEVDPTLGSRATHLVSSVGGLDGRALRAGDVLPIGAVARPLRAARAAEEKIRRAVALPDRHARLRVLAGPDRERFTDDSLDVLQSASYAIAPESNRMGFRLQGPAIQHSRGADLISDATPLGTLQVPAAGQPILLMADRQTTGGYPRIATVISADIGIAGQLGPGDSIAFAVCHLKEAVAALIAQERVLMAIEETVR